MKKEVSPVIMIVAGVVLVGFIAFLFMRTVAPKAPEYTISPPNLDADGAKAKRANYLKTHSTLGNGAPAPAANARDERQ